MNTRESQDKTNPAEKSEPLSIDFSLFLLKYPWHSWSLDRIMFSLRQKYNITTRKWEDWRMKLIHNNHQYDCWSAVYSIAAALTMMKKRTKGERKKCHIAWHTAIDRFIEREKKKITKKSCLLLLFSPGTFFNSRSKARRKPFSFFLFLPTRRQIFFSSPRLHSCLCAATVVQCPVHSLNAIWSSNKRHELCPLLYATHSEV